jgi:hypothetical protein
MSALLGVFASFIKNLIWIGFALIESIMVTLAFNFLAPKVNAIYLANLNWKLPFEHVGYWHVFAFIIIMHYIGQFIQTITPKFVNINNTTKESK